MRVPCRNAEILRQSAGHFFFFFKNINDFIGTCTPTVYSVRVLGLRVPRRRITFTSTEQTDGKLYRFCTDTFRGKQ